MVEFVGRGLIANAIASLVDGIRLLRGQKGGEGR